MALAERIEREEVTPEQREKSRRQKWTPTKGDPESEHFGATVRLVETNRGTTGVELERPEKHYRGVAAEDADALVAFALAHPELRIGVPAESE